MAPVIVEVSEGKLKGFVKADRNGEAFYSFLGIPYGKPTGGNLRFQDPLPAEAWNGIKDATKEGDVCFQKDKMSAGYNGSENCLSLNVFTKDLSKEGNGLKPVLVYIHGGAFVMGGSDPTTIYDPSFLMTEDIVFVSMNYRLGILGFLHLDDVSLGVPGNAGLKDQTLALKWVQKNIKNFNGDPNDVTIYGISAGSASVHYHVLSKSSQGLFHKAIMQSGSALNPWPYSDGVGSHRVVEFLGKEARNDEEMFEILRNASLEELIDAQEQYIKEKGAMGGCFGPVIEKPNPNAFLAQKPIDIISSGNYNKVPLMLGYTSNEGLLFAFMKQMSPSPAEKKIERMEDNVPNDVKIHKDSPAAKLVFKKMEQLYHSGENIKNEYLLATDHQFAAGIIGAAKNHVRTSKAPVYLYRVSLVARLNFLRNRLGLDAPAGAAHGDDIGYIFKNPMPIEIASGSIEDIAITRFIKLWTNFAKYGNPTPTTEELNILWKPVEENDLYFLDIDKELTLQTDPESERMKLWKEIYGLSPETAKYL